ncbi:CaiB/BaiF CoA transferase family protein [Chromobacterium piscinae]|uniref:CaiB/BaiF CoA transferase family protein n=1 Tax=Chromobacterium piscinae TaxID=686831 RepID=UPI0014092251|nr:CaiB/BaiF CoA-transferase family protein [Chromobacterium piscinae]MBX9295335.1 CoA transferase [Chromobacterium vaccinii]MBX9349899.1 CoA transferase [Chromobacterium vaccinii]MBX9357342.1 CoA transferase [Chromobacterium vaccinii]MCD4503577.1 CoA transferase [Chromobacterium piscinae]MCD5330202.1 CoA transferase [Chromobacterium piscinae]
MAGALSGIKVVDLSRVLAGPWASQLLADLGAEVIKIEKPGSGDDTRQWAPPSLPDGKAAYFLCTNRGKRSLTVDISQPAGQDIVRKLVADADVVLENYKVGGLKKYRLDYDSLKAINPKLVYCSITGFGQTGPYASLAGYDYIVQGMSGLMSITGPADGEPHKVGVAVSDLFTGLYAANAVQAALIARERSGAGQHIDMALFDCSLAMLANVASNWLVGHNVPPRLGNAHANIVPYQVFAASDGHFILACGNDKQFAEVCRLVGQAQWARDPRYATNPQRVAHRVQLVPLLAQAFRHHGRDYWLSALDKAGVPCGPINNVAEAFADPQAQAREMELEMRDAAGQQVPLVGCPIKLSGTPVEYNLAPPALGEHTEQILRALGYVDSDIVALRNNGTV